MSRSIKLATKSSDLTPQEEIVREIKMLKHSLRLSYDPEKLNKLYNLIDKLDTKALLKEHDLR